MLFSPSVSRIVGRCVSCVHWYTFRVYELVSVEKYTLHPHDTDRGCGDCCVGAFAGDAIEEEDTVQTGGCNDEGADCRLQPSLHAVPNSTVQDEDGSASSEARRRAQGSDRQVKTGDLKYQQLCSSNPMKTSEQEKRSGLLVLAVEGKQHLRTL